jgi:hypothetical protein
MTIVLFQVVDYFIKSQLSINVILKNRMIYCNKHQ